MLAGEKGARGVLENLTETGQMGAFPGPVCWPASGKGKLAGGKERALSEGPCHLSRARKETQTSSSQWHSGTETVGVCMQGWLLGVEENVVWSRVIAEVVVQCGSWPREARQVGSISGEERGHRRRMVYFLRAQVEGDKVSWVPNSCEISKLPFTYKCISWSFSLL